MSRIVDFRERIMDKIRTTIGEFAQVDWYDGIFDVDDVEEWSISTPCAWVSINTIPTTHHSTGEMNAQLRCVVVIVESDRRAPRDADGRCWALMEQVADLANLSVFSDPNAAPASEVKMVRITDPQLRRDGVALGIVEWMSGLALGTSRTAKHEFLYHNNARITQTPLNLKGQGAVNRSAEILGLPVDDEGFTGSSSKDLGVVEPALSNDTIWEP